MSGMLSPSDHSRAIDYYRKASVGLIEAQEVVRHLVYPNYEIQKPGAKK